MPGARPAFAYTCRSGVRGGTLRDPILDVDFPPPHGTRGEPHRAGKPAIAHCAVQRGTAQSDAGFDFGATEQTGFGHIFEAS